MWGLAPVATRALVMHLAPLPLLAVRLGAASIILLPWCGPVLRRRPGRAALARLVAAGLLGMVGYNLPVTVGLQWVPASTAGLLLASEPVWILLLGRLFLAERVPGRSWAGAAVALGGVAILAGPGALSLRSGTRELAGAALVLLGTLLFGGYTLVIRPLSRAYGALPATAASTVAGSLPYAAFAGLVSPRQLGALPAAAWRELAFPAFGSTAAGMLLWNLAVSRLPGSRVQVDDGLRSEHEDLDAAIHNDAGPPVFAAHDFPGPDAAVNERMVRTGPAAEEHVGLPVAHRHVRQLASHSLEAG
jgi:drug/metabolite transporter (DMT)-like permease